QFINFSWDAGLGILYSSLWAPYYRAVRNANILLDNIDHIESSQKELFKAEARFVRAISYYQLLSTFGPVPLRKSEADELSIPRPSTEEINLFIETELLEALPNLPDPGMEEAYGRATKGAAYGY